MIYPLKSEECPCICSISIPILAIKSTFVSWQLKVGSWPIDDNSVQIFYLSFSMQYLLNFNFWICCCWENRKNLLRICVFSFVYFFCIGILLYWIVLSHVHKWVTSDVILYKLIFFSHELSWRSRNGEWVNIFSKMECSMMTVVYLIFGAKTKIAITGVHSEVREPLTKQLSNTLNSVLFPET